MPINMLLVTLMHNNNEVAQQTLSHLISYSLVNFVIVLWIISKHKQMQTPLYNLSYVAKNRLLLRVLPYTCLLLHFH